MRYYNKNFFQLWLMNCILLFLVSLLLKGFILDGLGAIILAGLVFALINALIRPLLILLSLPINILTLGLFTFFLNAFLIRLTASLVPGFTLVSFGAAFWGAILISLLGSFFNRYTLVKISRD